MSTAQIYLTAAWVLHRCQPLSFVFMILTSRHHPHFFVILIQNKNFLRFSKSRKGGFLKKKGSFRENFEFIMKLQKFTFDKLNFSFYLVVLTAVSITYRLLKRFRGRKYSEKNFPVGKILWNWKRLESWKNFVKLEFRSLISKQTEIKTFQLNWIFPTWLKFFQLQTPKFFDISNYAFHVFIEIMVKETGTKKYWSCFTKICTFIYCRLHVVLLFNVQRGKI